MNTNGIWHVYKRTENGWKLVSERGYTVHIAVVVCRELWLASGIGHCINS